MRCLLVGRATCSPAPHREAESACWSSHLLTEVLARDLLGASRGDVDTRGAAGEAGHHLHVERLGPLGIAPGALGAVLHDLLEGQILHPCSPEYGEVVRREARH